MRPTVAQLAADLDAGCTTSRQLVEEALARVKDPEGEGARAFVELSTNALRDADASDALRASGGARSLVEGIPISIKDIFDVTGEVTKAGSKILASMPPATADATAVARLRAAGAVVIGRTASAEFCCGTAGLNLHYGTPRNPFGRDRGGRVPGGSSSGSAVAVADSMCAMGLGSDTRGSVRIPAALCGVAGFKPTARRIPMDGVFPLSRSLDSVGPLANSVACCAVFDAIMAGEPPASAAAPEPVPLQGLQLLIPQGHLVDDLEPEVAEAFEAAILKLQAGGARVNRFTINALEEAPKLFENGGLISPEAYLVHQKWLEERSEDYDSRVAQRLKSGRAHAKPEKIIELQVDRAHFIRRVEVALLPYDAILYPSVASVAPEIAVLQGSDEEYVSWQGRLNRNTGLMNLLDGCAATIPCSKAGAAPVGLEVAGVSGADKRVLAIAQSIEAVISGFP